MHLVRFYAFLDLGKNTHKRLKNAKLCGGQKIFQIFLDHRRLQPPGTKLTTAFHQKITKNELQLTPDELKMCRQNIYTVFPIGKNGVEKRPDRFCTGPRTLKNENGDFPLKSHALPGPFSLWEKGEGGKR